MTSIMNILLKRSCALAALLALLAISASDHPWFFAYDGTMDLACARSADGNNPFFQGDPPNAALVG